MPGTMSTTEGSTSATTAVSTPTASTSWRVVRARTPGPTSPSAAPKGATPAARASSPTRVGTAA